MFTPSIIPTYLNRAPVCQRVAIFVCAVLWYQCGLEYIEGRTAVPGITTVVVTYFNCTESVFCILHHGISVAVLVLSNPSAMATGCLQSEIEGQMSPREKRKDCSGLGCSVFPVDASHFRGLPRSLSHFNMSIRAQKSLEDSDIAKRRPYPSLYCADPTSDEARHGSAWKTCFGLMVRTFRMFLFIPPECVLFMIEAKTATAAGCCSYREQARVGVPTSTFCTRFCRSAMVGLFCVLLLYM